MKLELHWPDGTILTKEYSGAMTPEMILQDIGYDCGNAVVGCRLNRRPLRMNEEIISKR